MIIIGDITADRSLGMQVDANAQAASTRPCGWLHWQGWQQDDPPVESPIWSEVGDPPKWRPTTITRQVCMRALYYPQVTRTTSAWQIGSPASVWTMRWVDCTDVLGSVGGGGWCEYKSVYETYWKETGGDLWAYDTDGQAGTRPPWYPHGPGNQALSEDSFRWSGTWYPTGGGRLGTSPYVGEPFRWIGRRAVTATAEDVQPTGSRIHTIATATTGIDAPALSKWPLQNPLTGHRERWAFSGGWDVLDEPFSECMLNRLVPPGMAHDLWVVGYVYREYNISYNDAGKRDTFTKGGLANQLWAMYVPLFNVAQPF